MSQDSTHTLLKGTQAEFTRETYTGRNEAGVRPIGTSVLILMDQCADKSSGGVLLPPEKIAQMNMASESGVIVAVGNAAFAYYDDGTKWTDYKPKPGDRVFTERYGGREIMGRDGKTYRMMTYTCVGGIEDEQPAPKGDLRIVTTDPHPPIKFILQKLDAKRARKKKG